jgi:hypothetical protein
MGAMNKNKNKYEYSKIANKKNAKFPIVFGSHESTCLITSSCFFLIPAMYAFLSPGLYFYGIVSAITTAVSVNYWRHADYGRLSRIADLIVSKVSFAIYCVSGFLYFWHVPWLFIIGVPGCLSIMFAFYYAGVIWERDRSEWVYVHMAFLLFVALKQMLVIYGASLYSLNFLEQ